MRVIVCGSRRWHNRARISDRLFNLPSDTTVVHGGARGADTIAGQEAEKLGFLVEVHRPDYDQHFYKAAPLKRNTKMAELGADLCIAFMKDGSTGTAHMISEARRCGIPVEIIE